MDLMDRERNLLLEDSKICDYSQRKVGEVVLGIFLLGRLFHKRIAQFELGS